MTTPASYDNVKITNVSPQLMSQDVDQLKQVVTDVNNQLQAIQTALQGLQLSWTGSSASMMQQFNGRWDAAATSLFGTQQNPAEGVLNRVIDGVQSAWQNFTAAEAWIVNTFNGLTTSLTSGSGSASGTPQSVTNNNGVVTAITEIFPSS